MDQCLFWNSHQETRFKWVKTHLSLQLKLQQKNTKKLHRITVSLLKPEKKNTWKKTGGAEMKIYEPFSVKLYIFFEMAITLVITANPIIVTATILSLDVDIPCTSLQP